MWCWRQQLYHTRGPVNALLRLHLSGTSTGVRARRFIERSIAWQIWLLWIGSGQTIIIWAQPSEVVAADEVGVGAARLCLQPNCDPLAAPAGERNCLPYFAGSRYREPRCFQGCSGTHIRGNSAKSRPATRSDYRAARRIDFCAATSGAPGRCCCCRAPASTERDGAAPANHRGAVCRDQSYASTTGSVRLLPDIHVQGSGQDEAGHTVPPVEATVTTGNIDLYGRD